MSHDCHDHQPTKATARFWTGHDSRSRGEPLGPGCEYRFALDREVYTPYYELDRLKTMFEALRDAIVVLHTLRTMSSSSKRFTHRDISVANVLWDEESKRATLVDLDLVVHEDRTMIRRIGAPYFITTELYKSRDLFQQPEETKSLRASSFRHNPLHDLESIWWLAVWTLCRHVPKSELKSESESKSMDIIMKLYIQKQEYESIFVPRRSWRPETCPLRFSEPKSFQRLVERLPGAFSLAGKYIGMFRDCLCQTHYGAAELDITTLHEKNRFETLYQELINLVAELLASMPDELELLNIGKVLLG